MEAEPQVAADTVPRLWVREGGGERIRYTVEPPIMDTLFTPAYILSIHFYLQRRDSLRIMDKRSSPTSPLFGGSTVLVICIHASVG